jgi:hypothetical protein
MEVSRSLVPVSSAKLIQNNIAQNAYLAVSGTDAISSNLTL